MANLTRDDRPSRAGIRRIPILDAYLRGYAVVDGAFASLTVPTRMIAADDDPIIPCGRSRVACGHAGARDPAHPRWRSLRTSTAQQVAGGSSAKCSRRSSPRAVDTAARCQAPRRDISARQAAKGEECTASPVRIAARVRVAGQRAGRPAARSACRAPSLRAAQGARSGALRDRQSHGTGNHCARGRR